ncbi:MAG: PTS sugar transporter subunit IIC [Clostridium sp.]|jgi:PTS system mannose-specific IIC component/D-glucosaminate-specific PTS system IIC component|uniref:PTS mannose/fructose/sorbose/N-acetylgalactosamine transporter subunit IIC n=1 Tax=Clostridium sp. TaxID=1506 RepID=UPI0025C60517|nr:PTS sugar transporter subunit IIC [Clostridium sp.]MCH3963301.1 PTS sugar transporter subunit IIC [Clostridium sp.]MCI1717258.1 PTS sugar transporter subunit IIC [Clostridium sp.]MCI1801598.1 PTS sugar transporter subunit IIC [Clostridium sp.]MCI1815444.1 PTS sugar transporter subunit IIC [Clostridium sp.]MCI1872347.1 PTS sugar transporter subunit IIC [Clostridium sp.]
MIIKAALVGLIYWLAMGRAQYYFSYAFRNPVVLGVFIGLVFGDVKTGLVYGATIQLMYMGTIAAGGNIPNDPGLAACIAIPAAIVNQLTPTAAVAIAVPVGILGVLINNVRRTINSFYNTKADSFVEKGEYDKLSTFSFLLPWLTNGVLYITPVFIATLFGPNVIKVFLKVIPKWVMNGLGNAGGMLPALGFALTLVVMGKKQYIPFFVLGFFLHAILGFSMLTGAAIALSMAMIVSLFKQNEEGESA